MEIGPNHAVFVVRVDDVDAKRRELQFLAAAFCPKGGFELEVFHRLNARDDPIFYFFSVVIKCYDTRVYA